MSIGIGSIRGALEALFADRASRLIAAIGFSVVACLGLLGAYLCYDLRASAWRNAERNADNILALAEDGLGRNLKSYERSLNETARLAALPEIIALDPAIARLALFDTSARELRESNVVITDAEGHVRLFSAPSTGRLPDFSDLPDVQLHRVDPSLGLMVSGPVRSRFSGRMIVRLTRRIATPDGTFAGIVIGAWLMDDMQALFGRLHIDEASAINIFHTNGTLLVRSPFNPNVVGNRISGGDTYRYFRIHGRGHYVGAAALPGIVGQERLFAFATLEGLPLILTVAVATDSIRAAWIYKAGIVVALVFGLSMLTFGLTVLLQRETAHRAAREASSRKDNVALALLARTDGLTGLPNRRGYDEALAAEWERTARFGGPLALLVVDADRFKQFNDCFGHHRGDEVLRAIAKCLSGHVGAAGGIACRLGGEEFAAILPGADAEAAKPVAEMVRRAVAGLHIAHAPDVGGIATVSVGLASVRAADGLSPAALFAAADAALYEAKSAGRNRVRAAREPDSPPLARSA